MIIGVPVGRQLGDSGTVGLRASILPFRLSFETAERAAPTLLRIRRDVASSLDCGDVALHEILTGLHVQRDASRHPLFQLPLRIIAVKTFELSVPGLHRFRR